MEQLIKISEKDSRKVVSAKELYLYLGYDKSQWARWSRMNISENQFAFEFEEWERLDIMSNGVQTTDFAISINFAKKIAMMAKTEKGEQARNYFIECEKQLIKPKTQIELIIESAQLIKAIEEKQNALEQRIEQIENRPQINAPIEHFSIMGYCHNIGKQIGLSEAKSYGIKCRRMCNELGLVIGKVSDPRFGSVNTYPLDVLKELIQ